MTGVQAMWVRTAAALGFVAVGLGAFGAHGLRARVSVEALEIWKTAVLYHLAHAVAMLALGLGGERLHRASLVCGLWAAGIAVFSGSLYLLTVTGVRELGAVTPVGGVCLLAGWLLLAVSARASYTKPSSVGAGGATKQGDPRT